MFFLTKNDTMSPMKDTLTKMTTITGVEIDVDIESIGRGVEPRFKLGSRVKFKAVCYDGRPFSMSYPNPDPESIECRGYVTRIWTFPTYCTYALTLDDGSHLGLYVYEDALKAV